MKDVRWITVVGWSPMAAVNGFWWAVKKGYRPLEIIVFNASTVKANLERFREYVEAIYREYVGNESPAIEVVEVKEEPLDFYNALKRYIEQSKLDVMLDITPGRKFMSAFVLHLGELYRDKVAGILYVHLFHRYYENAPYPLIPEFRQKVYNLKELGK